MIQLNGKTIKPTFFPDKTSQVWKLDESIFDKEYKYEIFWQFEHEGEIMHLAQLKELLWQRNSIATVTLMMDYLPYGRQDKEVTNTTTFALRVFADMINRMHFDHVIVIDPHSEVAADAFINFEPVYGTVHLQAALDKHTGAVMCYPDGGAAGKYRSKISQLQQIPYTYGNKIRNQLTGEIEKLELVGDVNGKDVLIVDDICDGGRTFVEMAKLLKSAGANDVNLYVTHIINPTVKLKLTTAGISNIYHKEGVL